ncbi:MAG: sigma-70 family RNA polymerase sigma factor [Phycisphaerales bacterium]|nr:sigma-70 family RNA polymerase sigma factor [Phycisphaerales bacterium]
MTATTLGAHAPPAPSAAASHAATHPEASAEDLARDAQAGSLRAFTRLVETHERRVFAFLLRRTRSEADAEEMTQETFLRAWRSLGRYDAGRPFATWLFTIASRIATDAHRRAGVARERPMVAEPAALRTIDADDRRRLGNEAWIAAGEVLNERQHVAVWLRYVENLPPSEIARVLGVTGPTARIILFRARQAIARALAERGLLPEQYNPGAGDDGGEA